MNYKLDAITAKGASARRSIAVAAAVTQGLLGDGVDSAIDGPIDTCSMKELAKGAEAKPFGLFYDGYLWKANLEHLRLAFESRVDAAPDDEDKGEGPHFLHACAVKTNPLAAFLKIALAEGHGAECASVSEVMHSLKLGFKPSDVIFDSPCKTIGELRFALGAGVQLNLDNLQELARVEKLLRERSNPSAPLKGTIGIRVNPLVGAGSIAAFSVSTGKSKFGVPLLKSGDERTQLVAAVATRPWISCVHVHTGSGGMGLDQLVTGIRTAVDFALEVNANAGKRQISVLDIGGGLAVNFNTDACLSGFEEYAAALKSKVPEIFDVTVFDRVVSEFGAALHCKFAWFASRVEYTKTYDGGRIALMHAGSDLFMRACYCPEMFVHHRVFAFNARDGSVKQDSKVVNTDIAGPLCFAGDVVVHDAKIPVLEVNDIVVLADVGGNSLSIRTSHCSRQAPPVYVYDINEKDGDVSFQQVRPVQPLEETIMQWN